MTAKTPLELVVDGLREVHRYRDSDPRRARFLRDRLYKTTLEELSKDGVTRQDMVALATTALQCEEIDIAPGIAPRVAARR